MPREVKMVGVPDGCRIVRALPDPEPVEFPWPKSIHADWITEDLKEELE